VANRLVNNFAILNLSAVYKNAEGTGEAFNLLYILFLDEFLGISLELCNSFTDGILVIILLVIIGSLILSSGASSVSSEGLAIE